jgi:hypothetical protein
LGNMWMGVSKELCKILGAYGARAAIKHYQPLIAVFLL